jgi:hypothetical protein
MTSTSGNSHGSMDAEIGQRFCAGAEGARTNLVRLFSTNSFCFSHIADLASDHLVQGRGGADRGTGPFGGKRAGKWIPD